MLGRLERDQVLRQTDDALRRLVDDLLVCSLVQRVTTEEGRGRGRGSVRARRDLVNEGGRPDVRESEELPHLLSESPRFHQRLRRPGAVIGRLGETNGVYGDALSP